jgi:homoserine kinase type II
VVTPEQVRAVLRTTWHRLADDCAAQPGGITAANWSVTVAGQPYVMKVVPAAHRAHLEAGLAVADHLRREQIPAATAVRAVDGGLTGPLGDDVAALLRTVPGRPLDGTDPVDQQWWGDALGTAHRSLSGFSHPGLAKFHSVRPDAAHLGIADWVRPAVVAAVLAVRRLCVTDQLTYGVLHGDPMPSAFRLDPRSGSLGLVDWGPVASGPLTYDLAAAVISAGGICAASDLIDAYLAAGPVPRDEMEAALPTMLLLRWAAQADHFARRLAASGGSARDGSARDGSARDGSARDEDRRGLEAARVALTELVEELPADPPRS